MTIHITFFGAVFLPLVFFLPLLRVEYLLVLLPIAAVMQSMAVVIIGVGASSFGVSASHIVFAMSSLCLLAIASRARRIDIGTGLLRVAVLLWTAFSIASSVGAMVLPWLFAGLPVQLMVTNIDLANPLQPLRWTISNLAQAINSVGHCIVLLFAMHITRSSDSVGVKSLLIGFAGALGFTLIIGAYHRLMLNGFAPDVTMLLASNVSYIQSFNSMSWAPYMRTSLPFIEPSYASSWFAAVFAGGLVGAVISSHRLVWICIMIAGLSGLANSAGASGITASAIFLSISILMLAFIILRRLWTEGLTHRNMLGVFVVMLVIFFSAILVQTGQREIKWVQDTVNWKSAELAMSGDVLGHRGKSNLTAISITKATYGMGVGAGSNRASSYLLSLLSNTGALGAMLFLSALGLQIFLVARNCFKHKGARRIITATYLGAFACLMIAVIGAIPDQNWPVLWAFITLGLILAVPPTILDSAREMDQ